VIRDGVSGLGQRHDEQLLRVTLYIKRWLTAPLQQEDGARQE